MVPARLLHPGAASGHSSYPPQPPGPHVPLLITLCFGTQTISSGRKVTLPSPRWGQFKSSGFMCSSPGRRPKRCRRLRAQRRVWPVTERDQPHHLGTDTVTSRLSPQCATPSKGSGTPQAPSPTPAVPARPFLLKNTPELLRACFWGWFSAGDHCLSLHA